MLVLRHASFVAILCVTLLVGCGIGIAAIILGRRYYDAHFMSQHALVTAVQKTSSSISLRQNAFQVQLDTLMVMQTDLLLLACRSAESGQADFPNVMKQLDANTVATAALIGSLYGHNVQEQFLSIDRSYIASFINYTLASKQKDNVKINQSETSMNGSGDAMATLFKQHVATSTDTRQLLSQQVSFVKNSIDAYVANDWSKSLDWQNQADNEVEKIISVIPPKTS